VTTSKGQGTLERTLLSVCASTFLLFAACERMESWFDKRETSTSVSRSNKAVPAIPKGPVVSESLQPVSAAWKTPVELQMHRSAVCVRSKSGDVACAKLQDSAGVRFRGLNLSSHVDRLFADPRDLCVARGDEAHCLGDSIGLPTNARTNTFGMFRRAFAFDNVDHLGTINVNLSRWNKDGTFSAESYGGGKYQPEGAEDWIAADSTITDNEACGLTRAGKVCCYTPQPDPGIPPRDDDASPVTKVSLKRLAHVALPRPARAIAVSNSYACALLEEGLIYCWIPPRVAGFERFLAEQGRSSAYPQPISVHDSTTPISIPLRQAAKMELPAAATQLVSGSNFVCVLAQDGFVYCWGGNNWGQLGQVLSIAGSRQPVRVDHLAHVTRIAAAEYSVCALTAEGGVYCWGRLTTSPYRSAFSQFKRTPYRITEGVAAMGGESNTSCLAERQLELSPEVWADRLRKSRDYATQTALLEQMHMAPAQSPEILGADVPVLQDVSLLKTPPLKTLDSHWLVRADFAIGEEYRSTRSQLLIPISAGKYCAVVPESWASIDRDRYDVPCKPHPVLGSVAGPYRARFITLTDEGHWSLEITTIGGRNEKLGARDFLYDVAYYDLRNFEAREVYGFETLRGSCARLPDGSPPGIFISRTARLSKTMPRQIEVEECSGNRECRRYTATYNGEVYVTPDDR